MASPISKESLVELKKTVTTLFQNAERKQRENTPLNEAIANHVDIAILASILNTIIPYWEVAFSFEKLHPDSNEFDVLFQTILKLMASLQEETQQQLLAIMPTLENKVPEPEAEKPTGSLEFSLEVKDQHQQRVLQKNAVELLRVEAGSKDEAFFDLLFFLSAQNGPISYTNFYNATRRMGLNTQTGNPSEQTKVSYVQATCIELQEWMKKYDLEKHYNTMVFEIKKKLLFLLPTEAVTIPFSYDTEKQRLIILGEVVPLSDQQSKLMSLLLFTQESEGWEAGLTLISRMDFPQMRLLHIMINKINEKLGHIYRPLGTTFFEIVREDRQGHLFIKQVRINPHFQLQFNSQRTRSGML